VLIERREDMLPGTIIMLLVIVVVIYGGSGWLMKLNFEGEKKKKLENGNSAE